MALRPGDGAAFFQPTPHHADVMAQRRQLLETAPDEYALVLPETAALVRAAATLVAGWLRQSGAPVPDLPPGGSPLDDCRALGRAWEPDWVILRHEPGEVFRLVAGAVCFPSGWALSEKLGLPIEEIHAPIPGLNASLGRSIQVFLERLKPGAVWLRDNWGLSADSALNHHPALHLRPLAEETPLTGVWLRYEEQLLTRLPGSTDVLFGIKVGRVRLAEILPYPEVVRRLLLALRTMPEEVAIYKGLDRARASLLRQLEAVVPECDRD